MPCGSKYPKRNVFSNNGPLTSYVIFLVSGPLSVTAISHLRNILDCLLPSPISTPVEPHFFLKK